MHQDQIETNLAAYLGKRDPRSRYASFDYCFNYFQKYREQDRLGDLLDGEALQLSCLHLGFYLASWGMLRGSTELLQRSVRTFVPVVEALVKAPPHLWMTDVDGYTDETIAELLKYKVTLGKALHGGASDILITKVMLGTMGCVPAFDNNFRKGFMGVHIWAEVAAPDRPVLPRSRECHRGKPGADPVLQRRATDRAPIYPGEGDRHDLLHRRGAPVIPPGPAGQVAAGATGGSWPCLGSNGYSGPLTVVCIDLSSNEDLAAFRESYSGPGAPTGAATAYTADGVRRQLADDLDADLGNGTVALSLEGPCWGHSNDLIGPYKNRPFETNLSAWSGRNGGPAALKAATLLGGIPEEVLKRRPLLRVTFGLVGPPITGQPDTLWIWEGYVTGPYRTSTSLPKVGCERWQREERSGRHALTRAESAVTSLTPSAPFATASPTAPRQPTGNAKDRTRHISMCRQRWCPSLALCSPMPTSPKPDLSHHGGTSPAWWSPQSSRVAI